MRTLQSAPTRARKRPPCDAWHDAEGRRPIERFVPCAELTNGKSSVRPSRMAPWFAFRVRIAESRDQHAPEPRMELGGRSGTAKAKAGLAARQQLCAHQARIPGRRGLQHPNGAARSEPVAFTGRKIMATTIEPVCNSSGFSACANYFNEESLPMG